MNEVKVSKSQQLIQEGWKICYIRPDRSVSTGYAVFTLLSRYLAETESGAQFEYKYSICNPKDSFCRREGVRVADERTSKVVTLQEGLTVVETILNDIVDNNVLTRDASLTIEVYHYMKWLNDSLRETINQINLGE